MHHHEHLQSTNSKQTPWETLEGLPVGDERQLT